MYLKTYFTVVTVHFPTQCRALIIVSTNYSPSRSNAATKCLCDPGVITLHSCYLNMNWLKNCLLTIYYLCISLYVLRLCCVTIINYAYRYCKLPIVSCYYNYATIYVMKSSCFWKN